MDLDTALAVLGSDRTADEVERAALAVVCGAAFLALVTWIAFDSRSQSDTGLSAAAGVLVVGTTTAYGIYGSPILLATSRRSRAVGEGPELVRRAVLAMQIAPTLEGAASFASEHGDGPLARSLDAHARRARAAPGTGWGPFADEWGDRDPALRRAISLLTTAATSSDADRDRVLDRALAAALDGTRDRLHSFAARLTGPTNAIYGFGVVLPLALVGALPAVAAAGVPVSLPIVVVVFDLVLPVGLAAAGAWLVARRPSAFPPTPIPRTHPSREDQAFRAVCCALVLGVLGWLLAPVAAPAWTRWLAAPGLALGGGLLWWANPLIDVRERVTAVEAGLPDAVELVGRRLRRGEPLEAAIPAVGHELTGPTAALFADAAGLADRLMVPPIAAFSGPYGVLSDLPSDRVESEVALLPLAAEAGPRGGDVLVTAAQHLDALRSVDAEVRRSLKRTTDTLFQTAAVFAPLIGGTTVALAARIGRDGVGVGVTVFPARSLGLAVGVYVLLCALVLAALATALAHGTDRARIAQQAGVALLCASVLFPTALVTVGALV